MAAAAVLPVLTGVPLGDVQAQASPAAATPPTTSVPLVRAGPRGDAWDPDLINPKKDWPRKLSAVEMETIGALCDVIIPADAGSPSATAVGAHQYINEHVSAPGEGFARDLVRVRGGVSWLNQESQKRFKRRFAKLSADQKRQICDDICYLPNAKSEFAAGARFFSLVRNLAATAFYTTDAGMKDVGYMGNMALPKWDPPPAAILKKLGLD
jgi:hypothetical protein